MCALLTACGGSTYNLRGTDLALGSDAEITADVDTERNLTALAIEAKHLAPADRVIEGGEVYVVWAQPDLKTPWIRLGALELDDEGRTGTAQLTVSAVSFELKITAEVSPDVGSPSDKAVFSQRIGSE